MELYQLYGPAVRRKCERILGNTEDAEDVMHSLFIYLIKKQKTDVDLPYLFRAATNRCLNLLRNRKKRSLLLAQYNRVDNGVSSSNEPFDSVSQKQLLQRLASGFDQKCAEVFVYYYLDNMTQEEISEFMQLSRKSIGKKLNKIRNCVRKLEVEETR